jgi:CBS domain-containing protein
MKLKEIMTDQIAVVQADDTVHSAAQKMRDRDVGFLPVLDGGELIGVVTDRDLVTRAVAGGAAPNKMIGLDMVTSPAVYLFDDQSVEEAAQLMREHQIRRLVILNRRDRSVVGVLSLGDLAANSTSAMAGEVLQVLSGGFVKTH